MSKFTYTPLAGSNNSISIANSVNNNFATLQAVVEKMLSRDGTSPNTMLDDIDMNSNRIVNLPRAIHGTEPLRLQEYSEVLSGQAYLPEFEEAIARTVAERLQEVISVKDFGAIGDGVTNDRVAFNNGMAYLYLIGGGKLYVPRGNYLIEGGSVEVYDNSYSTISGEYVGNTVIVNGNTNLPAIRFGDNVTARYGNGAENLTFACKSGVTGVSGQYGIAAYQQHQSYWNNLKVWQFPAKLYKGFHFNNCNLNYQNTFLVTGCISTGIEYLKMSDLHALFISSFNNGFSDTGNTIVTGGDGVDLSDSEGCYFYSLNIYGNGGRGLNAYYTSKFQGNNFFVNPIFDSNDLENALITCMENSSFTNLWVSTNRVPGANDVHGCVLASDKVKNVQINGGAFIYNNGSGLKVYDNGSGSPTSIRIVNTTFGTAVHYNGRGLSTVGYGLEIVGASDVIVTNSFFGGNSSGPYSATSGAILNILDKDSVLTGSMLISGTSIGYTTNAGGTVTQLTSKATSVTLDKACGQITLNNAALAAGTIVSFTLTNSTIGATDVLILNHVSGGTLGAYSLNARCSAGSAIIDVRNNTGGSLSEAIVIRFTKINSSNT